MDKTSSVEAVSNMSFEEALQQLETIVQDLEGGETSLENSLKAYEKGMALKNLCEEKLSNAHKKIEKITFGTDQKPKAEPFDTNDNNTALSF